MGTVANSAGQDGSSRPGQWLVKVLSFSVPALCAAIQT